MSIFNAHQSIVEYVTDNWTHTALLRDNEPEPETKLDEITTLSITDLSSQAIGVLSEKSNRVRYNGLITMTILTESGQGSGRGMELAQHAVTLLTHKVIGEVFTKTAYAESQTQAENRFGTYCITTVFCRYEYDAFHDAVRV